VVEQLRELSQRRLSAAVRTGDELLWEIDADGVLTYLAPSAQDYFGYEPQELVGRHIDVLLPSWERARAAELLRDSARRVAGWTNQRFSFLTRDGRERILLNSGVAHVGPDGQVVGFAGTIRRPGGQDADAQRRERDRSRVGDVIARRALRPVFQPIMDSATGTVVGAEALSRFPDEAERSPDQWFSEAEAAGLGEQLELLAMSTALEAARQLPPDLYVSVNLSPTTLTSAELVGRLLAAPVDPARLVIEITEHASVADYGPLAERIGELRRLGLRIAVDDAGAGFASFRHILELTPDYIKLDRDLVDGIDTDPARRALVGAVVTFARDVGFTVIAEGVERPEELRTLQQLGVASVQGFLLGRPSPAALLAGGDAG
jgi:PAS domain S-box-containing protein